MFRASTVLAAAAAAALAVSAAPASAGSKKPRPPSPEPHAATHVRNLNDIEGIDFAVKDGTSNTIAYAERRASFSIDIGSSEAVRNGGHNGIIAVLIGL